MSEQRGTCDQCKHWSKTGEEDSGLFLKGSSTEKWIYAVGICNAPPALGNGSGGKWASWQSCYTFKRGKNK